ncbi:hypothetical protein ANO11243_043100 [Dothideomycetidae sp. 11243]|nr:hypothetical protein ANO11243_043100 [fungal sp. No.11243]
MESLERPMLCRVLDQPAEYIDSEQAIQRRPTRYRETVILLGHASAAEMGGQPCDYKIDKADGNESSKQRPRAAARRLHDGHGGARRMKTVQVKIEESGGLRDINSRLSRGPELKAESLVDCICNRFKIPSETEHLQASIGNEKALKYGLVRRIYRCLRGAELMEAPSAAAEHVNSKQGCAGEA